MKLRHLVILSTLLVLQTGCGTTYLYRGCITAEDTTGKPHRFELYWQRTERPLWFDEADGGVRLKAEASTTTLDFEEKEDGIVWQRGAIERGVIGTIAIGGTCGRILDARHVTDLREGQVLVTVYCDGMPDEFAVAGTGVYPKPRDQAYVFVVHRWEASSAPPEFSDCSPSP